MKSKYYVQCFGKDIEINELTKIAKEKWKNNGNKIKDIDTLNVYLKPEEHTCYYVVNDEVTGSFRV